MVAPAQLQRISVQESIDQYLVALERAKATGSLSPVTVSNYQRDLAQFALLAGPDTILDDITPEDLDDIMVAYRNAPDARYKHPAGRTRSLGATKRFKQSVSRMFSQAQRQGWVQMNPVPDMAVTLKGYARPNEARVALPEATAHKLLDVVADGDPTEVRKDQNLNARDIFILRLLMEDGPRVSEVSKADMGDIFLVHTPGEESIPWFDIRFAKGGKTRKVPLKQATYEAFLEYQKERPEPHPDVREDAERALLLTWRGRRMTPRDLQNMVARAAKRLPPEIRRHVTPHALRHTAASILLNSGAADVATVRDILGHASVATTGIYLDTEEHSLIKAVQMSPVTR